MNRLKSGTPSETTFLFNSLSGSYKIEYVILLVSLE